MIPLNRKKVVNDMDSSLSLIGERKQALITVAATGEIDVTTARGGA
jgi:hypothetical protein